MKKYKILFTVFTFLLLVNACSEKDLELTDPNKQSPETFFKNASQAQSAVNAAYANLQSYSTYVRYIYYMLDNMAQENEGNSQLESDNRQLLEFTFSASHSRISGYWEACYRGINKANFVIDNEDLINAIPNNELSEDSKSVLLGEAKFLRGLYYFYLVTRFGDVPLITNVPETMDGFPRSPSADVYAQIIQDLQDASAVLLDKSVAETGRATKGAAHAILGKVYLFRGEHALALAEFNKLSGYSLEPNYFNNFMEETEFGPESIFEIQFNDDLNASNMWGAGEIGNGGNEVTFRGQDYGCFDWFNVYPSDDLLDSYEVGDTRYADNFYSVGDVYASGSLTVTAADLTAAGGQRRAGWKKYQNYYKDAHEDFQSGINAKYIRYADVLLMMAECENEVGSQATAVGYINQVRQRASLGNLSTTLSKDQVFDAIVQERKVELAGEQVRFDDIIRWGLASTELAGSGFQAGKSELWPIPEAEINSNDAISQADQNPGY